MENTVVKVVRLVGPKMAYTSKEFLQDRASHFHRVGWVVVVISRSLYSIALLTRS